MFKIDHKLMLEVQNHPLIILLRTLQYYKEDETEIDRLINDFQSKVTWVKTDPSLTNKEADKWLNELCTHAKEQVIKSTPVQYCMFMADVSVMLQELIMADRKTTLKS